MSVEDTGSRTPQDAARFEAWRSRRYDPPEDDGTSLGDGPPGPVYRYGYRMPTGCTCHSRSESPCDFCSWAP